MSHPYYDRDRKRHRSSPSPHGSPTTRRGHRRRLPSPSPANRRLPTFPSYLDTPDLHPKVRHLCEIVASTPPSSIPAVIASSSIPISSSDVETVLRLSYSHPAAVLAFFKSSLPLQSHSPYSWNLLVDLLGKNLLFPAMWDSIHSHLLPLRLLSLATFASIFSSFAAAGRPQDALQAFRDLPRFGIPQNTAALNSLLSALCRERLAPYARDYYAELRHLTLCDADTFAILLEGCENEGDRLAAHLVFEDMVRTIGWDPKNVPAYESFLLTLLRSSGDGHRSGVDESLKHFKIMREHRCFPGIRFFRGVLGELVRQEDARGARALWEDLAGRNGIYPDTSMYKSMILLQFQAKETGAAHEFFDEMVVYGVFPDAQIYNLMLDFLIKCRKFREAAAIFKEMVKNECCPSLDICESAMRVFLNSGDWETGVKVWKCMVANNFSPLEESGNMLVGKLKDLDRLPESCKYAEDMMDGGIKLYSSTLSKLKSGLAKVGKGALYDYLLRKWKAH